MDELVEAAKSGALEECWGSGTAAVISPVGALRYEDTVMEIGGGGIGPVSQKLYDTVTGIQTGKVEDTFAGPWKWSKTAARNREKKKDTQGLLGVFLFWVGCPLSHGWRRASVFAAASGAVCQWQTSSTDRRGSGDRPLGNVPPGRSGPQGGAKYVRYQKLAQSQVSPPPLGEVDSR